MAWLPTTHDHPPDSPRLAGLTALCKDRCVQPPTSRFPGMETCAGNLNLAKDENKGKKAPRLTLWRQRHTAPGCLSRRSGRPPTTPAGRQRGGSVAASPWRGCQLDQVASWHGGRALSRFRHGSHPPWIPLAAFPSRPQGTRDSKSPWRVAASCTRLHARTHCALAVDGHLPRGPAQQQDVGASLPCNSFNTAARAHLTITTAAALAVPPDHQTSQSSMPLACTCAPACPDSAAAFMRCVRQSKRRWPAGREGPAGSGTGRSAGALRGRCNVDRDHSPAI